MSGRRGRFILVVIVVVVLSDLQTLWKHFGGLGSLEASPGGKGAGVAGAQRRWKTAARRRKARRKPSTGGDGEGGQPAADRTEGVRISEARKAERGT